MKRRVIQIGVVGVDSGQLIMCDPAYIDHEWEQPPLKSKGMMHEILQHKDGSLWQFSYDRKTTSRPDVKPFPGTYADVIPQYGKTPNQLRDEGEMFESNIDANAHIPDGEFSYEGACKATLNNEDSVGQLNYKLGHAGAGVVFSTGMGDGLYPVYAELIETDDYGERIARVWVDFELDKGVSMMDKLVAKQLKQSQPSNYRLNRWVDGLLLKRKAVTMDNHYELGGRTGGLKITYDELRDMLGRPNANPVGEEKDGKIKARWYIKDQNDRYMSIWCYRYTQAKHCTDWSCGGSHELLREVFGSRFKVEL